MLKRYSTRDLGATETVSRRVSYDCTVEYAKSSRSNCHVCRKNIEQNELRLALMLQDIEGYKSKCWTHFSCFWKHRETRKLNGVHEIHNFNNLEDSDKKRITDGFEKLSTKGRKRTSNDNEEDPIVSKNKRSRSKSNKRKS